MKPLQVVDRCLACVGLASAIAFGVVASAAAAELEFVPGNGKFPVVASGTIGKSLFETSGGTKLEFGPIHLTEEILNAHLYDLHLEILDATGPDGSECSNTSAPETILAQLIAHLGLADPGDGPAVLLLLPSGFEFTCTAGFIKEKIKLKGGLIGEITTSLLEQLTSTVLKFEQSKGKQKYTSFLLSGAANALMTGQHEEVKIAEKAEEEAGQVDESTLTVANGGTLEIRD